MPAKAKKRRRGGEPTAAADRLKACHPNHVWALDFTRGGPMNGIRSVTRNL